jgi:uncharacterized protein YneF (UPF0154 family)
MCVLTKALCFVSLIANDLAGFFFCRRVAREHIRRLPCISVEGELPVIAKG